MAQAESSPVFMLEPVDASPEATGETVGQEGEQHKAGRVMPPHYTGRAEPTGRGKAGRAASWEPRPRAGDSSPTDCSLPLIPCLLSPFYR